MKFAFLTFDWNYQITTHYLQGMVSFLETRNDIQLHVINALGKYGAYQPDKSTFQIFDICDISKYDGILLQGNRTWPVQLREQISAAAKSYGIPVVSINYPLKNSVCIGTDNYRAEEELIRKIFNDYSIKKPMFVNGLMSSEEARDRARAYYKVCTEYNFANPGFYQADWQIESGVEAAKHMLELPGGLPDVIFCCNDDLAIGVQKTLLAAGVRIPEDVKITGFDNREYSASAKPRITSVDRDYQLIGNTAIKSLCRLANHEKLPEKIYSPVSYIFSESCGYPRTDHSEVSVNNYWDLDSAMKTFYSLIAKFQPEIMDAPDFPSIMVIIEKYLTQLKCNNLFVVVDEQYLEKFDSGDAVRHYSTRGSLTAHCGEKLGLKFDANHCYGSFDLNMILPEKLMKDGEMYIVYPLRVQETCIGYLVTEGLSSASKYGFLSIIFNLIDEAIEKVRQKTMMEKLNDTLDLLYAKDQLTDLYNRFGIDKVGKKVFNDLLQYNGYAEIVFVDIDDMKGINDKFGHDNGDLAIKETADIIKDAIRGETAFAMRYGGDEFVVVGRKGMVKKVRKSYRNMPENPEQPFHLSISIGEFPVTRDTEMDLNACISKADDEMYLEKRERKLKGTLS